MQKNKQSEIEKLGLNSRFYSPTAFGIISELCVFTICHLKWSLVTCLKKLKTLKEATWDVKNSLYTMPSRCTSPVSSALTSVIQKTIDPYMKQFVKNFKEFMIVDDPVILKDYDVGLPRPDQVRSRAQAMGKGVAEMIKAITPSLFIGVDEEAVFGVCFPVDEWNFVPSKFLFRQEYARLQFDVFGRVK